MHVKGSYFYAHKTALAVTLPGADWLFHKFLIPRKATSRQAKKKAAMAADGKIWTVSGVPAVRGVSMAADDFFF